MNLVDTNNEEITVGDSVVLLRTNADAEIDEWYSRRGRGNLTVYAMNMEAEYVWLDDCPYAIPMRDVLIIRN